MMIAGNALWPNCKILLQTTVTLKFHVGLNLERSSILFAMAK